MSGDEHNEVDTTPLEGAPRVRKQRKPSKPRRKLAIPSRMTRFLLKRSLEEARKGGLPSHYGKLKIGKTYLEGKGQAFAEKRFKHYVQDLCNAALKVSQAYRNRPSKIRLEHVKILTQLVDAENNQ